MGIFGETLISTRSGFDSLSNISSGDRDEDGERPPNWGSGME